MSHWYVTAVTHVRLPPMNEPGDLVTRCCWSEQAQSPQTRNSYLNLRWRRPATGTASGDSRIPMNCRHFRILWSDAGHRKMGAMRGILKFHAIRFTGVGTKKNQRPVESITRRFYASPADSQ